MTIDAALFANVIPGVVNGGGNPLALNALFFTQNAAMPTGTVFNFGSIPAVVGFFGPGSPEAAAAAIYFAGFTNSTTKPSGMLFAAFNLAARDAFLQGGSLAGVPLTTVQALTGTLTVTMDGTPETSSNINLSAATSFSNAASLIQAGFTAPGFTVSWNAVASAFVFTNTLSGPTSTISFATGTLASGLLLGASNGGFVSQGAALDTPATAVANAIAITQNFAAFLTLWEPTLTDKENFAVFNNALNNRYAYLVWDSDANASVQGNTTCFGAIAKVNNYGGVAAFSGDPALALSTGVSLASLALNLAIFAAGAIASVNFNQTNGRRSLAYLSSGAINPTCANTQTAKNLVANGYSYYGSTATAAQNFIFLYNGQMFGVFGSIVRYINQIWMNAQFQLSLIELATQVGISYTPAGYGLIRASLSDDIQAALNFGAIRPNVTLSATQISEINQAAGVNAASQIASLGSFLQISDPGAEARALGQTPIIDFWYADGGDVLSFSMASIAVL